MLIPKIMGSNLSDKNRLLAAGVIGGIGISYLLHRYDIRLLRKVVNNKLNVVDNKSK